MAASYSKIRVIALALDPVHVGAGGGRIGRVDLTIVRDPVTRVPKIPGSSLAGVYRTYVAMHYEEERLQQQKSRQKAYYPDCAGLGLDEKRGHCRSPDCPVCTVFGFARGAGQEGGFAGLASFTDAHVLLFPVPTRQGPMWVTSPMALERIGQEARVEEDSVQVVSKGSGETGGHLNLGWLLLRVQEAPRESPLLKLPTSLGLPEYVRHRLALVSDRLFPHIVNSNLEVRTSVSIDPATGAAQDKALFSYEALPRGTVLTWEVIAKNPGLFRIGVEEIKLGNTSQGPERVLEVVKKAHPYLEYLGVGGMGTRGMGRIRVIEPKGSPSVQTGGQP